MYCVYILRSAAYPEKIYVGCTQNLKKRLSDHNAGTTEHTRKYAPWALVVYLAFDDKVKAMDFEKYLKSNAGKAFRNKRLIPSKSTNKNNDLIDQSSIYAGLEELRSLITKRVGAYLDMREGFLHNLQSMKHYQRLASVHLGQPLGDLDKLSVTIGKGHPASDKRQDLHVRTQEEYKADNSSKLSSGKKGFNYGIGIENFLSDIYNYCKIFAEKQFRSQEGFDQIMPIMSYMGDLRNRIQHDLYGYRIASRTIALKGCLSGYPFPSFKEGSPIDLSDEDMEALIIEINKQFDCYLIPYIQTYRTSLE